MKTADKGRISELLQQWAAGDLQAREDLIPLVYQELRKRAAAYLRRERRDHTLQPTALVNEAYMRLMGQQRVTWLNRAQFFGVAAQIMRRILVDHARERQAAKRPGGIRITLHEGMRTVQPVDCELLMLDAALQELARLDERQAHIVELKYFGGLSEEEVAAVLSLSRATITREWQSARAWLYRRITKGRVARHDGRSRADGRGSRRSFTRRWRCAPDQRAAFLRDACGEDDALRDEVESLLAAHADAGSFADRAAIDALASADPFLTTTASAGDDRRDASSDHTASWGRSMPVAWVRCIARSIRDSIARWPSRCCRPRLSDRSGARRAAASARHACSPP